VAADDDALERAVAAVNAAQDALYAARRDLSAAIVAARLGGQSVPRIAERTGLDRTTIRNALTAAGLR
jgi:hypothetical protein